MDELPKEKEHLRRLMIIAARERVRLAEVEDIRQEGDARGWHVIPRKRANFKKSEEEIQKDLKQRREITAAVATKPEAAAAGSG